jgi:MFS family permease
MSDLHHRVDSGKVKSNGNNRKGVSDDRGDEDRESERAWIDRDTVSRKKQRGANLNEQVELTSDQQENNNVKPSKHSHKEKQEEKGESEESEDEENDADGNDDDDASRRKKGTNRKSMFVLLFAVFVDLLAVGLVVPLLPYYAEKVGADAAAYGLIGTVYGLLQIVGGPLSGVLSDRVGRKVILLASFGATAISYAGMARATSLSMLLLSRVPVGLLKQTISTAHAYTADLTSPVDRTAYIGFVQAAVSCGFIIGPAVGGVIGKWLGLEWPAYIAALLYLFNIVLVTAFLPDSRPPIGGDKLQRGGKVATSNRLADWARSMLAMLRNAKPLAAFLMLSFVMHLAMMMYQMTFPLYTKERFGVDAQSNGFILAYLSFLSVVAQAFCVPALTLKLSEYRLIVLASLVLGLSQCAFGLIYSLQALLILLVPWVLSSSVLSTCMVSMITLHSPANYTGSVMGLSSIVQAVSRSLAPLIGGELLAYNTAAPAAAGGALFGALTIAILWFQPLLAAKVVAVDVFQ